MIWVLNVSNLIWVMNPMNSRTRKRSMRYILATSRLQEPYAGSVQHFPDPMCCDEDVQSSSITIIYANKIAGINEQSIVTMLTVSIVFCISYAPIRVYLVAEKWIMKAASEDKHAVA